MTALHGFLGLPSDWNAIPCTSAAHKVDWMPMLASTSSGVRLPALAEALNELASDPDEILVGYSMGGRIALHMLVAQGGARWKRAIIVSASPGIGEPSARAARAAADRVWSERFRRERWDDVTAAWNAQGAFVTDGTNPLVRREEDFDREHLALALVSGSVGLQEDLRERLAAIGTPTLWIAGERDAKYAALARECADLNPRFTYDVVPDAGHRLPWTAPMAFCAAIATALPHN
ncbi:MAG: alpha/beta fold hydrolase [Fimbriimonadaceae bacterium]